MILVAAKAADVEALLKTYLARSGATFRRTTRYVQAVANDGVESGSATSAAGHAIHPEMLRRCLDRNDATGRAGERVVYAAELDRLSRLGCRTRNARAHHGRRRYRRGYDIRSEWNGEVRCIEVKSSTLSTVILPNRNEREVLTRWGARPGCIACVWLLMGAATWYIVCKNPMSEIPEAAMRPVVWRVDLALKTER